VTDVVGLVLVDVSVLVLVPLLLLFLAARADPVSVGVVISIKATSADNNISAAKFFNIISI
jgi:hypothetical protein